MFFPGLLGLLCNRVARWGRGYSDAPGRMYGLVTHLEIGKPEAGEYFPFRPLSPGSKPIRRMEITKSGSPDLQCGNVKPPKVN